MIISNRMEGLSLPLEVGQFFVRSLCFDVETVKTFATLVGDLNLLHHDRKYAKKSPFGDIIASGSQTSSILAAMVAKELCSLKQSLGLKFMFQFHKPVYADTEMTATWKLTSLERNEKLKGDVVTLSGQLTTKHQKLLVSGTTLSLVYWEDFSLEKPFKL